MASLRLGGRQKVTASPKTEIGEIDTRAPFQSVKAAVSLFGEVAICKEKPVRRHRLSSENILERDVQAQLLVVQEKEARLLLVQSEIERSKQQIERADNTKARALNDLERAKSQVQDITARLKIVCEFKESAVKATEAVNKLANQLELAKSQIHLESYTREKELEYEREQYMATAADLDAVKQELNEMRQDFDATLEAKQTAFQQAAEANLSAKVSSERVFELQMEIEAIKEAVKQIEIASKQAYEEQAKIVSEKDILMESYTMEKEEVEKNLINLRKEYDPELNASLEMKVAETTAEIEAVKKQMKEAHAAEMDLMRIITTELTEATRTLQQVADEECSLRNSVSLLKMELEEVKREYADELNKNKAEEKEKESVAEENTDISDERDLELEKLLSENENARREAEEMKKNAEDLKQEAESARKVEEEAEKKLQLALSELEEAKAAERKALDELNILSLKPNSVATIGIKKEEFESMNTKAEDCGDLAEKKLEDVLTQLEAINRSKCEADKKLERSLKAIEEINAATEMALQSADSAVAAQRMVEAELQRWREEEQTTAA